MPGPFYKANVFALLILRLLWVCFEATRGDLGLLLKSPTSFNPIMPHSYGTTSKAFF